MADTEGQERLVLVTPVLHAASASLDQAMNDKFQRQRIACKCIASIPAPPLASAEIAVGLWAGGEALGG